MGTTGSPLSLTKIWLKMMSTKLKLVLVFMLVCVCQAVRSQTFYQLTFTIPDDDVEYVGLLIYTDQTHCKMRLVGDEEVENGEYYEANYTCRIEEKDANDDDDIGVMYYEPDDEDMPILIWAWKKTDQTDISEAPIVCFDLDDVETWFEATDFQEITLADMDEEYISQFYNEDEKEYKMMLNGSNLMKRQAAEQQEESAVPKDVPMPVLQPGVTGDVPMDEPMVCVPEPPSATLHLIVTANTNVSDIGQACQVDLNRVKSEFAGVAKALGMTFDQKVVSGNDYGKEAVQEAISELNPKENDVVLFVYSGHGFRFKDQKDFYPNMDLAPTAYDKATENYIPLSQVFSEISKRGGRLNIVLSDCCNSEVDETLPIINTNSLFSRSNTNFDINKLRVLFIQSEGNIIATAASPGEYSWCGSNGGFFLLSLIESMRNQISALTEDMPSWDNLIKNAIEAAASKSESNQNCKRQNGVKYVKIKSVG